MKKILIAFIVILSILIIVLFWGNEDEQDLGDNYYYLPKYEAIDVGYPGGAIIYKSTQKYLFSNIKIYDEVICAKSDEDFVIAIQKLDSSSIGKDSLQYFIIAKKSDYLYGPYNKISYLQKREELKVPKDLIFKEE